MKRILWIVLGATLAGPGCLNLPAVKKDPAPPPAAAAPTPAPPAVTADQVNEKNAYEMAKALKAEQDYDLAHVKGTGTN